jgi:ribosomal protein S18 acetylase RimI-like enzyme
VKVLSPETTWDGRFHDFKQIKERKLISPSCYSFSMDKFVSVPLRSSAWRRQGQNTVSKPEQEDVQLIRKIPTTVLRQTRLNFKVTTRVLTCGECGLKYTASDPDDVALHTRYHKRATSCLQFRTFSNIAERMSGSVFRIKIGTIVKQQSAYRRITALLDHVDEALGAVAGARHDYPEAKQHILLHINTKNIKSLHIKSSCDSGKIIGVCLIDEEIDSKLVRAIKDYNCLASSTEKELVESRNAVTNAFFTGISRIWVHPDYRRRGIALRLLKTASSLGPLAYSQPTESGFKLARSATLHLAAKEGDKPNTEFVFVYA